jgi:hypothetical protein
MPGHLLNVTIQPLILGLLFTRAYSDVVIIAHRAT